MPFNAASVAAARLLSADGWRRIISSRQCDVRDGITVMQPGVWRMRISSSG
jgi:hypothetical protein